MTLHSIKVIKLHLQIRSFFSFQREKVCYNVTKNILDITFCYSYTQLRRKKLIRSILRNSSTYLLFFDFYHILILHFIVCFFFRATQLPRPYVSENLNQSTMSWFIFWMGGYKSSSLSRKKKKKNVWKYELKIIRGKMRRERFTILST